MDRFSLWLVLVMVFLQWKGMPAVQRRQIATESVYFTLRERVLSGVDHPLKITRRALADASGLSDRAARQVLTTLAAEGYLSGHNEFTTAHLTRAQIVDWATILEALTGIAAGQLGLGPGSVGLCELKTRAAAYDEAEDEERFFAMVGLLGSIFRASTNSRYLDLVSEIVPPAFLRILWLADTRDKIPFGLGRLIYAVSNGDHLRIKEENAQFWQVVSKQAVSFIDDSFIAGTPARRLKTCRRRDVNLSGEVWSFSRSSHSALLPPM